MPRPSDNYLMHRFVNNIASAIFRQIGLDTEKLQIARTVVRINIYECPLFSPQMNCTNVSQLKYSFDEFVEKCLKEVLQKIS